MILHTCGKEIVMAIGGGGMETEAIECLQMK